MATSKTKPAELPPYPVGSRYRPWGVDAYATVVNVNVNAKTVTLVYDHSPKVRYQFKQHELDKMGRRVPRTFSKGDRNIPVSVS